MAYSNLRLQRPWHTCRRALFSTVSLANLVWLLWSLTIPAKANSKPSPVQLDQIAIHSSVRDAHLEAGRPECLVPLPGLSDSWTELQAAFAASWQRRCQLDQKKFTILMTSSNERIEVLRKILALYASGAVPSLSEIYIRWLGDPPHRPGIYNPMTSTVPVRMYQNQNNSLVNRWQAIPNLSTAYVFSHDDDMEINASDLEWAWQVSKSFRPAFTSFVGRRWEIDPWNNDPRYKIGIEGDSYSMGTSASWIHSSFMDVWNHSSLGRVREAIDAYRNCEDIAMAFVVPHLTKLPPLAMIPRHDIIHWQYSDSVSLGKDHWAKRDACGSEFYRIFGALPPERDFSIQRGLGSGKRKIKLKHV